jgi:hypothetical protein
MDFSKIKKGIFSIKESTEKASTDLHEQKVEKVSYRQYGFERASAHSGRVTGLDNCLKKIYADYKEEVRKDAEKQDELKRPSRIKIEEYKGDIERLERKLEKTRTESIPKTQQKIDKLKEEKSHIRKNPQEITGDDAGKASYYIGSIILTFLTIYLFIFYSSASYSGFFKEFSLNEIGVANSIFDARALSKALHDGVTELVLILTIPFVFLGLGYLIHKFQEQKTYKKFFKIAMLVVVTFIFDGILAYEITEKIYNIKKENSFQNIPDYTMSSALHSINFWLIIFAGFVVYLIWGFVFDFVIESHGKMDKVKVALNEKDKQIKEAEADLADLEVQIDKMSQTIDGNKTEINKLNRILEGTIVPREFEQDISHFFDGWHEWMVGRGMQPQELTESRNIVRQFLNDTMFSLETINPN